VRLYLPGGEVLDYCHLSAWRIDGLGLVRRGDVLGIVGDTGLTYGPHLHINYWLRRADTRDGRYRNDPAPLFGL